MGTLAHLLPYPLDTSSAHETDAALVGKLDFLKELGRDEDAVALLRHMFGPCPDVAWFEAGVGMQHNPERTVTYFVYVPKLVSAAPHADDGSPAAGSTVAGGQPPRLSRAVSLDPPVVSELLW